MEGHFIRGVMGVIRGGIWWYHYQVGADEVNTSLLCLPDKGGADVVNTTFCPPDTGGADVKYPPFAPLRKGGVSRRLTGGLIVSV